MEEVNVIFEAKKEFEWKQISVNSTLEHLDLQASDAGRDLNKPTIQILTTKPELSNENVMEERNLWL